MNAENAAGERRDLQGLLALHQKLVSEGGVVVVKGPRGVGKVALLESLRAKLTQQGRLVLLGRAQQSASTPYAIFREPAAQALSFLETRGLAAEFLDRHSQALSVLVPSLASLQTRAPNRTSFFEALRSFFVDLAQVATPTLILNDVHYGGDDTRDLVAFVAAHLFDPRAIGGNKRDGFSGILIASLDDDALDGDMRDIRHVHNFEVKGLSKDDLLTYLSEHPALDKLLAASHGRPDDIDALLESLPDDADAFLIERVQNLDEVSTQVLDALSVSARPSEPQLLADAIGVAVGDVALALTGLLEQNLVARRLQNGSLLFDFARVHHRHVIKDNLSDESVAALHESFATVLEKNATQSHAQTALLAHHFLAGAHPTRGVPYAIDAVERLLQTFAYGSAVRLCERALHFCDKREDRMALLDQLTSAQRLRGEIAKALDAAEQMHELAEKHELASVLRRTGELRAKRSDYPLALSILNDAAKELDHAPDAERSQERAKILMAMADVSYQVGDHETAEKQARALLEGEDPHSPVVRIQVANTLGKVAYALGRYDEAAQVWSQNQALADEEGEASLSLQASVNLGIARFHLGDYAAARDDLEKALTQARAIGDILQEATALVNLGAIGQRVSDIGRAIQSFTGAMALFSRIGRKSAVRLTTWNLANVYNALGMHETAEHHLSESRRISNALDSDRGRAFVHFTEGDIAYDRGQYSIAKAAYENARRLFERTNDTSRVYEMAIKTGWSSLKSGDKIGAQNALELAGGSENELRQARHDALKGALAIESSDEAKRTKGAALLSRACEAFIRNRSEEEAWRTALYLADVYETQGDVKSAAVVRAQGAEWLQKFAAHLEPELREAFAAHLKRTFEFDLETGERALPESVEEVHAFARSSAPSQRSADWNSRYGDIIGAAPELLRVFDRLDRIVRSRQSTVLVRGESGTGKELVAAAVHREGPRKAGPFVRVNCGALVETLLLSELFGHEKGAFTGAFARKQGRFEMAQGGTIFLDEIGDISPKTQVSLLRVLQEKTFERVGGAQTLTTDAAIICATHRNLEEMVQEGTFREDLYYRLRGVVIELPALRERHTDIPELAMTFLHQAVSESQRGPRFVSHAAQRVLSAYAWPGNIRELQNVMRSVALFCEAETIEPVHLAEFPELFGKVIQREPETTTQPIPIRPQVAAVESVAPPKNIAPPTEATISVPPGMALNDLKKKLEFDAIADAIRRTQGNITQAAKLLKMKRPRLSQIVNGNPELKAIKNESRS